MKLAYIISAYKLPDQLIRLVDRLNGGEASFFIHVDRRTPDGVFGRMREGLDAWPNVQFLHRHPCVWGGFSHVEATLEGIREVVRSGEPYASVILLTGQDYPIKPNAYIQHFFEANRRKAFLEYFPLPHVDWQNSGMDRIEAWHWRVLGRHFVLTSASRLPIRRRFPPGFEPYGGSSYWCLPKECIDYIHKFAARNPSFVDFFRRADVPDELFFQTIVLNSPWRDAAVNDDLRYVQWNDSMSGSPAVLTVDHLPSLCASPKLFARKFDATVDGAILDEIDRALLGRPEVKA